MKLVTAVQMAIETRPSKPLALTRAEHALILERALNNTSYIELVLHDAMILHLEGFNGAIRDIQIYKEPTQDHPRTRIAYLHSTLNVGYLLIVP